MSSSSAPSAAAKKPSLYARKLLEKLRTLNSNASLESRQTLANWMVFNRKKAEGMGEGLLLAIDAAVVGSTDGGSEAPLSRLMLLLRVTHQVFIEGKDDSDVFEKSLQLRLTIADVALVPLFKALATTANGSTADNAESEWNNYQTEIKEMIDIWKEYNVFDGPTVWEGYKKAWGRALADANKEKSAAVASAEEAAAAAAGENDTTSATETPADGNEVMDVKQEGEQSSSKGGAQQQMTSLEAVEPDVKNEAANDKVDTAKEDVGMTDAVKEEEPPSSTSETKQEEEVVAAVDKEPDRRFTKRDSTASVASVEIDFDAEGVEEAYVDPQKFLETSKVIASLQIARGTLFVFCVQL
jgi:hypothetical protein